MPSTLVAISAVGLLRLALAAGSAPTQLHLACGADPATSMTFSWATTSGEDASTVRIWSADGAFNRSFTDESGGSAYTITSKERETYTSPFIHHVRTTGLSPETTYTYVVGGEGSTSAQARFTTAPETGAMPRANHGNSHALGGPLTFGVIGDLGQTTDSASTVAHLQMEEDVSLLIHAGDLSYADCEQPRWDSYAQMIEPLASTVAWMTCPGNHEIEADMVGNTFTAYEARFAMPEVAPAVQAPSPDESDCTPSAFQGVYDYGNAFYSFDYSIVHVVMLNSYTNTSVGSSQYEWLKADLAKVDRSRTPWIIAAFHCPWYNSNDDHRDEFQALAMQDAMEPLFLEYGVNVVFVGHVHAYERTYPVANGQTSMESGVTYVTIGDGGNREGHSDSYLAKPDWSAYRNGTEFGHGRVQFYNATTAIWQWRRDVDAEPTSADEAVWTNNFL